MTDKHRFTPEQIDQRFDHDFPVASGPNNLREDLEGAFAIGSDPNALPADKRAIHERALAAIGEHNGEAPYFDEAYEEALAADPPSRLRVSGPTRPEHSDASHHLTELEAEQFARFGLVRHHFATVSSDHLDRVEALCDLLYKDLLISSTTSFLYDPDLLELVLNQELHDRVESLLGDQITFVGADGPMYLPPRSQIWTEWHSASGRDFGGGDHTTNLDLVSCWIAFTDAKIDNGCMKMVPGSFFANGIKDRLLKYTTWDADVDKVVSTFRGQDFRFREDYLGKLLARRIGYLQHKELYYVDGEGNPNNYNGFHSVVDRDMAMGPTHLDLLAQTQPRALEAERGDLLMFTSQNTHASFRNTSDRWRKAVSLRFVRTNTAHETDSNHHHTELCEFVRRFPKVEALFSRAGKSPDDFADTMPRLLIKGDIPRGHEHLYWDIDFLREQLAGGHLLDEER